MRLFVGVWPSDDVLSAIAALPRPDRVRRWTLREQWHVTLHFFGEVDEAEVGPAVAQLRDVAARHHPRTATLGPATRMLGRANLVIPVRGLDDLGAAFGNETFTGHLTLARDAARGLTGAPFGASWEVREIALIVSHLGGGPARYENLAVASLA